MRFPLRNHRMKPFAPGPLVRRSAACVQQRRRPRVPWLVAARGVVLSTATRASLCSSSLLPGVQLGGSTAAAAMRCSWCAFGTDGVINPDDVAVMDTDVRDGSGMVGSFMDAAQLDGGSFESFQAWSTSLSPELPSTFTDVDSVDVFARPRMLTFVRRYRTTEDSSVGSSTITGAFQTEELSSGGVFHARLRLPVTPAAARFVCGEDGERHALTGVWAHGVANSAKDAELLAAMHAEQMADLLGYHLYSLPSRQRKHAEAARSAGRYASSPDDTSSGPAAQERRAQWPLPLRRVLTDEETEGGKWQLVDTSAAAQRFTKPPHTLLSPCLLDAGAKERIEARFATAPPGCPPFAQQLSVDAVRTLTASGGADGCVTFVVAQLTLPVALTALPTPVVASGKAQDRATAVLLACMHAELLLDALYVPLFDDAATQQLHSAAAVSYGRPAPLGGAKVRNPAHVHLPDPLKQLVVTTANGRRQAMRSVEEQHFHHHDIVTEQTGTFLETSVAEANAMAVLTRFLEAHNAPRASAAFLQTPIKGRVRSTVLLPLPESFGIRGGVGVAAKAHDADILAAMHALDVLCMLGIPVITGDSDRAAEADASWKAARRAQLPDVPATVSDAATPSPPARRCSAKGFASIVVVETNASTTPNTIATAAAAAVAVAGTAAPTGRRRVAKRAKVAADVAAERDATLAAEASAQPTAATTMTSPTLASQADDAWTEEEAHLTAVRQTVDAEFWDLTADSPDGYMMIAPGTQHDTVMAAYAIASPRRLDKMAKARVMEYLSTVGRHLDDVRVKQCLTEEETEGRQRKRCVLKLPLPSVCGEPRLALGEADNAADAEHAACMHAELVLDALGVCIFADPVQQLRHAQACAQWGRWAPSRPRQERPSTTPSPPPLRREHTGSLHWERKKAQPAAQQRSGNAAAAIAETQKRFDVAEGSTGMSESGDAAPYTYIVASGIDTVSRTRVHYYLRHERLPSATVRFKEESGVTQLKHVATWELPIAPRYTVASEESSSSSPQPPPLLSYTAQGVAGTRKDAEALAWMHAERLLGALGIPIFPNLPKLQAYHARHAAKEGWQAPTRLDGPSTPLSVDAGPPLVQPLQLEAHPRRLLNVELPTPPDEAAAPGVWDRYVSACESYITARLFSTAEAFLKESRAPRTGDVVVDVALAEAEAGAVNMNAISIFVFYSSHAHFPSPQGWAVRGIGGTAQCSYLATVPLPGFDYLQARGVGETRAIARHRAAMHSLALYRRVDPNYTYHYTYASQMALQVLNKNADAAATATAAMAMEDEESDFDLDTFSTLPNIASEAQKLTTLQTSRHQHRLNRMFVEAIARINSTKEITEDGKRRAIGLYVQCCGLAAPRVREMVRLLPRESTIVVPKKPSTDLELEVAVQVVDEMDPMAQRVECGATFATEISLTDEDGREWAVRHASTCAHENYNAAYDKLFAALQEHVPAMAKVMELLDKNPYLRPEEVPQVEIPAEVAARMQACLKDQKDLLLAEGESGVWNGRAMQEEAERRWWSRQSHKAQSMMNLPAWANTRSPEELATMQAVESAAQLERLQQRITNPVYLAKYAVQRAKLSIAEQKVDIVRAVRDNPVTVVCGTTGCGKTTQIPQYIFDDMIQRGCGGGCRIVVTQPRRISATSIARRVAEERMESIGDSVGYMIRFDSKPGSHISFVTTGVLLRMLHSSPTLSQFTHIIIDEIHERDLFTDFFLVLVRDLLPKRPDLRVVLMSATLQASDFQQYFDGAPLIQVEGHQYPVKEYFLEDLLPFAREHKYMTPLLKEAELAMGWSNRAGHNSTTSDAADFTQQQQPHPPSLPDSELQAGSAPRLRYNVLPVTSQLDYPTVQFAVEQAARMMDLRDSSILVFLPGWQEMVGVQMLLDRNPTFHVVMLHSTLASEAQSRIFLPAPPGKVKVVLSTNIAESGVTIDDVGVVIDSGRSKERGIIMRTKRMVKRTLNSGYDVFVYEDVNDTLGDVSDAAQSTGRYTQLKEVYASRANCVQRRGRVGRTRPGICIRLFSRRHFDTLHEFQTPQMHCAPLDSLCLNIVSLGAGSPEVFLRRALEPPPESEVVDTMRRLVDIGAVSADGALTPLGYRLSLLSLDPSTAKTVLLGAAFGCLDSALSLAATAQSSIFSTAIEKRKAARMHREDLSMCTRSDVLASVNAFNYWAASRLTKAPAEVGQDLNNRQLRVPKLIEASHLKDVYRSMLLDSGFLSDTAITSAVSPDTARLCNSGIFIDESAYSRNSGDVGLLKAVLAAGTFPNVGLLVGPSLMRTSFENSVKLTQDSVLVRPKTGPLQNPFVVYKSIGRFTSLTALMSFNMTALPFWAFFLVGTRSMTMEYLQDLSLCVMNDWLYFRLSLRSLQLLRKFKVLLDRRLNRKFVAPDDETNNKQLEGLTGIVSSLMNAPCQPYPALHPGVEWAEAGRIISPHARSASYSASAHRGPH